MRSKKVDIIIPTYNPDLKFIFSLLKIREQSIKPNRIIIINTDETIWRSLDMDARLRDVSLAGICEVYHIDKAHFDHGETRNIGVLKSKAEYFLCMTQDANPANTSLIENLLRPMSDEIKLTYARQKAYDDASHIERFTRHYNYPAASMVKSEEDRERLGIKTYFSSNVCAMYERKAFVEIGGFEEGVIFNEDMLYAAALLKSGKKLKYVSDAVVYHSHNYTAIQQFRRNFDIGVSQTDNPKVFAEFKSEKEGINLVRATAAYLWKISAYSSVFYLFFVTVFKYLGFRLGKAYKKLPKWLVKSLSSNRTYWEYENV